MTGKKFNNVIGIKSPIKKKAFCLRKIFLIKYGKHVRGDKIVSLALSQKIKNLSKRTVTITVSNR